MNDLTKPANYCRACQSDFMSVRLFDAHRVGKQAYTLSEGLTFDPPREDGRRCLSPEEMRAPRRARIRLVRRGRDPARPDPVPVIPPLFALRS